MQAEHSRSGGFIISPLCAPEKVKTVHKTVVPARTRVHSDIIARFKDEYLDFSHIFTRFAVKSSLSATVAICAVVGFCNFFTLGTAVYCEGNPIAFTNEEKSYYSALSAAKSYAENYGENIGEFSLVPSLVLKSRISTSTALMNKLLTASSFTDACTLYYGNTPVFSAENETVARDIVSLYISDYSMSGQVNPLPDISYKQSILPLENVSTAEECRSLLESSTLKVVSVVNTLSEKKVPFETLSENDDSLYIGESITVREGSEGSASLTSEIVYENGTQISSKILSEEITVSPVARLVRVGTKSKDVLKEGLYRPLSSGVVSSEFGKRWGRNHEGLDIAVPIGTPVKSAECGTVTYCGDKGTYGKFVQIDHGNGVITAYAHLDEITVSIGQAVKANQQIALSGNTGRSTGPHLHFEVVRDGVPLNPRDYIKKS